MSRLIVAPIVEGHGEEMAIRILLRRLWTELLHCEHIEILKPIRAKRYKMTKDEELKRLIGLAGLKLQSTQGDDHRSVIILVDADDDCPAKLGPQFLEKAQSDFRHLDVSCVVAKIEYETWFVAAAESLTSHLDLKEGDPPENPEGVAAGKGWIKKRWKGISYSETIDQPAMTARMDLQCCRNRSPSFDKLCRELEKRANPSFAS